MKSLRTSPAAKLIAVILAVLTAAGGFWASFVTLGNWDDLWMGKAVDFYDSNAIYAPLREAEYQAERLAYLYQTEQWNGSLTYSEEKERQSLKEALDPANTNLRFQIHTQDGSLVYDNLNGAALDAVVDKVRMETAGFRRAQANSEDRQIWDSAEELYYLAVTVDGETQIFTPGNAQDADQYGWYFSGYNWSYDADADGRRTSVEYVIEYGAARPLSAHDAMWEARNEYGDISPWLPGAAALALALDLSALGLTIFLCLAAGRRREGGRVRLNWHDRVPYDLYLLLQLGAYSLLLEGGSEIVWNFNQDVTLRVVVGLGIISIGFSGCALALILTTATRLKTHTVLRSMILWRICARIGRGIGGFFARLWRNWSLVWRVGLAFVIYLIGTVLTGLTVFLIPVYQGLALYAILRWIKQWEAVRAGVGQIIGGNPDFKIDTKKMYPDLREHAEQLNDLGGAIGNAVDERLKSERFKAELITNVSHDLKTPLTSIINYVDLLKKEEVANTKALEYIEVLDRKSQRLKKLTEDLVEASKASTGTLTVNRERLGVVQLTRQALGEYEEKFAQSGLELVPALPEEELYVQADGRHLWRILDNLLSNCCKYALGGTRVYLDVNRWDGSVNISVKNISRQALNIPPDQLMERFVRGEESRSTEGSGLGLSIARSLTELQGGAFRLAIDGDLFKAVVTFPEAGIPVPPPPALEDGQDFPAQQR